MSAIALAVAIECLARAREGLADSPSYEAARSARIAADIYLDLAEGRRGARVAIDARSVSVGADALAALDTERLLRLADALDGELAAIEGESIDGGG